MCRLSDAELNCVSTKIFLRPACRQLLSGMSMQTVLATDRDRRFGPQVGEREQARAASAAEDDGENVVHVTKSLHAAGPKSRYVP